MKKIGHPGKNIEYSFTFAQILMMQATQPDKSGLDQVLNDAFFYWNKTLFYNIVFSLIYFAISFIVLYFFAIKWGLLEKFEAVFPLVFKDPQAYNNALKDIMQSGEAMKFSYVILGVLTFLYPLNLGLMKMFRKIDLGEKVGIEDLFAGYSGSNFFIYTSYFAFWYIIFGYAKILIIPAILWVFVTLFCAPLMFFMDKRIMESIQLSIKAIKLDFITVFVGVIVALLFRYIGIFTIFGALFTFPFWNAMIYALYKKLFTEVR